MNLDKIYLEKIKNKETISDITLNTYKSLSDETQDLLYSSICLSQKTKDRLDAEMTEECLGYLPIISDYTSKETYFCDYCNLKHTEIVGDEILHHKTCFETNKKDHYKRHLKTKKHLENVKKVEKLCEEEKKLCKLCNNWFSKEQWKTHINRNYIRRPGFVTFLKNNNITCNNIVFKGKRFDSIKSMMCYKNNYEEALEEVELRKKNKRRLNNKIPINRKQVVPPSVFREHLKRNGQIIS